MKPRPYITRILLATTAVAGCAFIASGVAGLPLAALGVPSAIADRLEGDDDAYWTKYWASPEGKADKDYGTAGIAATWETAEYQQIQLSVTEEGRVLLSAHDAAAGSAPDVTVREGNCTTVGRTITTGTASYGGNGGAGPDGNVGQFRFDDGWDELPDELAVAIGDVCVETGPLDTDDLDDIASAQRELQAELLRLDERFAAEQGQSWVDQQGDCTPEGACTYAVPLEYQPAPARREPKLVRAVAHPA